MCIAIVSITIIIYFNKPLAYSESVMLTLKGVEFFVIYIGISIVLKTTGYQIALQEIKTLIEKRNNGV